MSGVAYGIFCNKVVGGLSQSLWETVGENSDYTLVFYFKVNITVFCQAAMKLKHLLELVAHFSPILGKHIEKDDFKLPLLKLQSVPSEHFKVAYPEELTEVWRAYGLPRPLFRRWPKKKKSPCNHCIDVRSLRKWKMCKKCKNATCQRETNSLWFKLNIIFLIQFLFYLE